MLLKNKNKFAIILLKKMNYYWKEKLDELYNINIYQKNKQKILSGGIGDKFLANAKNDNRMSLDILIRLSPEISTKIEECISELKSVEPNLYYYPKEDFHITVIDILKGAEGRTIPTNLKEYKECIQKCIREIKPFKIEFKGLTASDNAVMVKGYYEYELQKFRELLRKELKEKGLALEERYETISSHITIMRIPDKLENPNDFCKFIELGQERMFGIMNVNSFELSFHNWYDTKKEVLLNIEL
jgi:2'-5' RNA ligase